MNSSKSCAGLSLAARVRCVRLFSAGCALYLLFAALGAFAQEVTKPETAPADSGRQLLWKGDRFEDWTVTDFGSQREVKPLEDGGFEIEAGYPLSGVHSTAFDWPQGNYELEWEFQRVEGNDFPCCLTFPVKDSHCSVVIGGWGGTLVGLSCIDGKDAAHNDTAKHIVFENEKWYPARLRVEGNRIRCWISDKEVISFDIGEQKLSVRNEVQLSQPLGICCFETKARIRKFRLYSLTPQKSPRP